MSRVNLWTWVVLAGLAASLACAQDAPDSDTGQSRYYSLHTVSSSEMSRPDAELLRRDRTELAAQARFYGYDLSSDDWSASQAFCPLMPDHIMMHYQQMDAEGRESLFTALLPREQGKVQVVPIYYRSATPFHPAAKSERNYAVFNRTVSPEAADEVGASGEQWLEYGVCYAEMVGGPISVLLAPGDSPRMFTVAPPAKEISMKGYLTQIRFADRISDMHYDYWTLDLAPSGKLRKAGYDERDAPAPLMNNPPEPRKAQLPEPPEPKSEQMHPPPAPQP